MIPPFPSVTATWHNTSYPAINPAQPHLSLKGKAVLITGGGRGIGAATVRAFAAAGASLIGITGRTSSPLDATKSAIESEFPATKILVTVADVTDEAAMDSAFSALSEANEGMGVDICIHNAAYLPNTNPIAKADTSDWWSGFTINILGSFIVTRAFLKHKNTSPTADPVLVGVSTGATAIAPSPGNSGYEVSKFGASRFFDAVATEEKDIRVMQVLPGVVETDMNKKSGEAGTHLPKDDVSLPADFMVWAVSQDAAFLHGRMIWCNWDVDELKSKKDRIISDAGFMNLGMIGWPFQS